MRKIISVLLCIIVSMSFFVGCSLFSHDFESDMKQVVATINPIHNVGVGKTAKNIYKTELYNLFNQQGQELIQNQGKTYEEAFDYCLDILVSRHLVIAEADKMIADQTILWDKYKDANGDIKDSYTQTNDVLKQVYTQLDNELATIKNKILDERSEEKEPETEEPEEKTPTYPLMPAETNTDSINDLTLWTVSPGSMPGASSDASIRSLELNAVRRLVVLLYDSAKEDFRATADDKKLFEDDMTRVRPLIEGTLDQTATVYPILHELNIVKWLITRSVEEQVKLTELQKSITAEAKSKVSTEAVALNFEDTLQSQKNSFNSDPAKYVEALKGTDPILYRPNSDYFYVKHILLPFSAAQTAQLTAAKNSGNFSEAALLAYRSNMATQIKVYPHKDGEDDKTPSSVRTVSQVYDEISAKMAGAPQSLQQGERNFKELVYKYNTDPGMFTTVYGYAVEPKPAVGVAETYMQEFADEARALKARGVEGALSQLILTDFGYHIMYLAQLPKAGSVGIDEFQTPARLSTFREAIKAKLVTEMESRMYEKWEGEKITYYTKTNRAATMTVYKKRYENLYKKADEAAAKAK